jgi:hypothetical protein
MLNHLIETSDDALPEGHEIQIFLSRLFAFIDWFS